MQENFVATVPREEPASNCPGKVELNQIVLVRHPPGSENADIEMILDYYSREGIPLENIKARGDIASYSILFYRYRYVTDRIFGKGDRNYGYPDYAAHYIGGVTFRACEYDPAKWSATVTSRSRNPDGTRNVYTLFDDTDPGIGNDGKRWAKYYHKISSGNSRQTIR